VKVLYRIILLSLIISILYIRNIEAQDSLTTVFIQEKDTRTLSMKEEYSSRFGNYTLYSNGGAKVTLRTLPGYETQWKDDLNINFHLSNKIRPTIDLLFEASGQEFRDHEASFKIGKNQGELIPGYTFPQNVTSVPTIGNNSQLQRAHIRTGFNYNPKPHYEYYLLGGVAMDRQEQGGGEDISGRTGFEWYSPDGRPIFINGDGWVDNYGDRRNNAISLYTQMYRDFGEAKDFLIVSWGQTRNDQFQLSSSGIEKRTSENLSVTNRLITPLSSKIDAIYNANYRKSVIDIEGINSKRGSDLDFIHSFQLKTDGRNYFAELSYDYGIEDREYYGNLILGRKQRLTLSSGWQNSYNDSLTFYYGTEKLKYDSPDSLELSDRDRLIHSFNLHGSYYLYHSTRFTLDALVLLDHIVNIESQRSADNRWNRVFRIAPGIEWVPVKDVRNRGIYEVLANYSVYDFDNSEYTNSIRSNVFRKWSAIDTLSFPVTQQLKGEMSFRYDLEDRGRVRWEEFKQELSHETRAFYTSMAITRILWSKLYLKVGYRVLRREEDQLDRDANDDIIRFRARTYEASGPFTVIESRRWKNARLLIDINLLRVDDSQHAGNDRLDTFKISYNYLW